MPFLIPYTLMCNTVTILSVTEGKFLTQSLSKSFPFWKEIIISVAIYSCYVLRINSGEVELAVLSQALTEHICSVSAAVALVMEFIFKVMNRDEVGV